MAWSWPRLSSEIELMKKLVDKEIDVALKLGEMRPAPPKAKVPVERNVIGGTTAEAYRVILAYRQLQKQAPKILAEAGIPDPVTGAGGEADTGQTEPPHS